MPSLRELQTGFMREVFGANDVTYEKNIATKKLAVTHRLAIYRNNVRSTLHGALQDVYPVVKRLVGEDFFRQMAREYLMQHPSPSGDLHEFGATFPAFITNYPEAAGLIYLADTAKLEWLYHQLFHAAEHPALNLERLAEILPEQYAGLKFSLHPASALLTSPFPIHRIWAINQAQYVGDDSINLNDGGVCLLLSRSGFTITITPIAQGEFIFLQQLAQKIGFSEACETALDSDQQLDLNACFQHFIVDGIIVDFSH